MKPQGVRSYRSREHARAPSTTHERIPDSERKDTDQTQDRAWSVTGKFW